jgi:Lon protease-like protein
MTCAELDNGIAPITDEELTELPIFPLPQCVLLPGGLLPLHVFEPRYRELTRHCLEGNRPIGIARLRRAASGDLPSVYPHVGVGRIICSEELEDGRFLLLVRGAARVVIDRELPATQSFRRVAARRLIDGTAADPAKVSHLHHQLMAICDRLAVVLEEGGRQLRELAHGQAPGACADAVAAALMMDADERQALLEQTCPQARLSAALAHVSRLLCQVVPCDGMVN